MLNGLLKILKRATEYNEHDVLVSFYAVWILSFLISAPLPSDDLLRDVIIGNYNFDYKNLYIHSPLMVQYNQYILFDWLLHQITVYVGNIWTVRITQLFTVLNFVIPLQIIFLKIFKNRQDKYILVLIALAITINSMVLNRLYLGRPEAILAGWVLWGFAVKGHVRMSHLWMVFGVLAIPLYWLTIIYTPMVLVVYDKKWHKMCAFILLGAINIIFWQLYSHGQWLHTFQLLHQEMANRLDGQVVSENNSIIFIILSPAVSLATTILIFRILPFLKDMVQNKKLYFNKHYIGLVFGLGWFMMPNMIRYVDIEVPILMIILAKVMVDFEIKWTQLGRILVLMSCLFSIFYANQTTAKPCKFTDIPKGSKVLATFNGINYYVPFFNKQNIQIAPSMEVGSTEKNIQIIISDIQMKGRLDCKTLTKYDFDYLVERSLISVPQCLSLAGVYKEYRLWKIKK